VALLLFFITLSWRFCSHVFFSYRDILFWGKRAKSTGTGVRLATFYTDTFRSSSILSLIRPCLPYSRGFGSFPQSFQVSNLLVIFEAVLQSL
jgi:hypothetical protein